MLGAATSLPKRFEIHIDSKGGPGHPFHFICDKELFVSKEQCEPVVVGGIGDNKIEAREVGWCRVIDPDTQCAVEFTEPLRRVVMEVVSSPFNSGDFERPFLKDSWNALLSIKNGTLLELHSGAKARAALKTASPSSVCICLCRSAEPYSQKS